MRKVNDCEQIRRLSNRWVFDCANRLIADEGLERKHAFEQAAKAFHLLELLGEGEVRFEYLKANGELRKARGTLCPGVSVDFDHYVYKDEDADTFTRVLRRGVYVYFDLDCKSFRSFSAKGLISIDV